MKYIIGMGNMMRSDDGIGSHIINYIIDNNLEDGFTALNFASNAWGILPLLNQQTEKILIIDCTILGKQPGEYQFFDLESVLSQNKLSVESHESSIVQLIRLAETSAYIIPDITIMGIEPESMEFDQHLSEKIANNLVDYVQAASQFIQN